MKRFNTTKKGIALAIATLSLALFAAVPIVAADQSQQTSEGQFTGGNIFYVKDETQNGTYGNTVGSVNACDDLRFKVYLYNPGPSFLSSVNLQATLPTSAGTSVTSTITASSDNADPSSVSASATANLNSSETVSYVPGTTELLDGSNNLIEDLPDGITQGGVNIGDLAASGTEFVQFDVKVSCPAPVPAVCNAISTPVVNGNTIKISYVNYTSNSAEATGVSVNYGNGVTNTYTSSNFPVSYTYPTSGNYTVTATVLTNLGNVTSSACTAAVTIVPPATTTPPPTTTPPATTTTTPTTPAATQLVNTGPGSVIGIFGGTSIVGAVAYRLFQVRKLARRGL